MSQSTNQLSLEMLGSTVRTKLGNYPVVDIHTHLNPPAMSPLALYGIDELLNYHYLAAELMRACPDLEPELFYQWDADKRADLVWQKLFVERSPMSEATRGVITVMNRLGLDVGAKTLDSARAFYAQQTPEGITDLVLQKANVRALYMTNDPMDRRERELWLRGFELDSRFRPVLRLDSALLGWPKPQKALAELGYKVSDSLSAPGTVDGLKRYVRDWISKIGARYIAMSLPPDFGEDAATQKLLADTVYPVASECRIPVAMMIGVRRSVNPRLGLAGDGNGSFNVRALEQIAAENGDITFLVTLLAREDQHPLCVAARKFANIVPFGCWWFLNNPSIIEDMTRMRLDMLGLSFIPQHSDARVLEQLLYKWEHSREIIARVLTDRYADLCRCGFPVTGESIDRDLDVLFGGSVIEGK